MEAAAPIAERPRTIRIENGERATPFFSEAEMERRLAGLRAAMAEVDVDAVLFTSIHNINYYADFLYCSFGRHYGLFVTADDQTSISANIDGGQPWRRTFGDNIVYTDWQRDNYFRAAAGLANGMRRLGVEFDHLTLEGRAKLEAAFPGVELVDVDPRHDAPAHGQVGRGDRRHPQRRADRRHRRRGLRRGGRGTACPSTRWRCTRPQAMVREIARTYPHAELMDTWTWFQSGINTDGAHNPVTTPAHARGRHPQPELLPDDPGLLHGAGAHAVLRLCADDRATSSSGRSTARCIAAGSSSFARAPAAATSPSELNEIYAAHDLLQYRTFGYGHSFGVLSHYYGREAGLELREDIDTVLEPDMVVSMEPMIMLPEGQPGAGGYREHDILVVTEDGAEDITAFPFGPEHNIIGA